MHVLRNRNTSAQAMPTASLSETTKNSRLVHFWFVLCFLVLVCLVGGFYSAEHSRLDQKIVLVDFCKSRK